ncbi:MAG: SDR family oxidoreductase [Bacteroidota bacterium]
MFDLTDKVAIVTGGAGALGGAMSMGLAKAGAKVAILSRTAAKVEAQVQKIEDAGYQSLALVSDVLDEAQLEAAKNKILAHWGKIDLLINCAGGNRRGATIMPEQTFFDLSVEDLDQVNALNMKGTVLPTLVFGQEMAKQKQGCIINISSMAAQSPLTRVFGYSAAKASVDNMTKWLAVEMAQKYGEGIRVNAIAPGFFIGEQNRSLLLNEDGSYTGRAQTIVNNTPMGRFGEPEELCGVVNWLCSDAASFVTGTIINVDGGFGAFSGV